MAINAIGNGIPFQKGIGIPYSIKNNMVLWYDIKRQGATNESMKANPILKDLSGNGHDATCYNFAWSGMSGIGGYPISFLDGEKATSDIIINSITNSFLSITIPEEHTGTWIYRWQPANTYNNTNYILNVDYNTNVENPTLAILCSVNGIESNAQRLYKGDNNIIKFDEEVFSNAGAVYIRIDNPGTYYFTIKPLYPNALVSDGVDDYYQTLPTYPKEVGTCFLTAQSLEDDKSSYILYMSDKTEESGTISSWIGTTVGIGNKNRIMLRGVNENSEELYKSSSPDSDLSGKGTIVFTWNNNIPLMVGRINDERVELGLEQLHTKYSWATDFNAGGRRKKMVFYSFLLFDRDLTEQEIEWVKHNLIEGDAEL